MLQNLGLLVLLDLKEVEIVENLDDIIMGMNTHAKNKKV